MEIASQISEGNKPHQLPKNVRENVRELKKHGKNMNSRTSMFPTLVFQFQLRRSHGKLVIFST